MTSTADALLETIRNGTIGDDRAVVGPFGTRRVTYADYTASGRSLDFIEDFIRHEVMPLYANTHTESSGTGLQTTRFREDARDIIREACGADREEYAVIFAGSGSTAAVDKLIGILNLRVPADLDQRYELSSHIPVDERPVVFIGPYEHHSNELPWRESIADVVTIERHRRLSQLASERVQRLGHQNVQFLVGDGAQGDDEGGEADELHVVGGRVVPALRGRLGARPPGPRPAPDAGVHACRPSRDRPRGLRDGALQPGGRPRRARGTTGRAAARPGARRRPRRAPHQPGRAGQGGWNHCHCCHPLCRSRVPMQLRP